MTNLLLQTIQGQSMGGIWTLRLPARKVGLNHAAIAGLVQSALDRVEDQMSAWRPASALCRVNAAPVGTWVPIPPEMALVISAGLHLMALAGGAFSILMGGASAREGFAPGRACDVSRISADVTLVDNRVRRNADIAMDLNAIAKGYAADLVAEVLIGAGYQDFLIEMAGDTLACGQRPDGLPWTVALELPIRDRIIPARLIPLVAQNGWQAVATSGGYRRAIGEKSHLMSPISGAALPASAALVAVVAPTTMEADGWATVMAVLGPEAGLKLAARYRLAVAYIERCPPDGFQESGSPAMAALLAAAAAS